MLSSLGFLYCFFSLTLFLCCLDFQSLLNIGAMLGGPLGGWSIDFFGRKIALILTSIPFGAGWLLIGLGKNEGMLHAGRFFSGLGVGMASLNVPVGRHQSSTRGSRRGLYRYALNT